jgi:hypothetical protein
MPNVVPAIPFYFLVGAALADESPKPQIARDLVVLTTHN